MNENKIWLPPMMRFLVELTTWFWLLFFNFLLLILSILSLAVLNFPGDKRPSNMNTLGFEIPGALRIFIEINSAILGMLAAYSVFSTLGFVFQVTITLFSFYLDSDRWGWMLGRKPVPNYVTYVHKKKRN